jgi:hypothetical protein
MTKRLYFPIRQAMLISITISEIKHIIHVTVSFPDSTQPFLLIPPFHLKLQTEQSIVKLIVLIIMY